MLIEFRPRCCNYSKTIIITKHKTESFKHFRSLTYIHNACLWNSDYSKTTKLKPRNVLGSFCSSPCTHFLFSFRSDLFCSSLWDSVVWPTCMCMYVYVCMLPKPELDGCCRMRLMRLLMGLIRSIIRSPINKGVPQGVPQEPHKEPHKDSHKES